MSYNQVEQILHDFTNDKISEKVCISKLLQELTNNKLRYGLYNSDEEDIDDFFFYIYKGISSFLKSLPPYKTGYSYLFYHFVRQHKASWKKRCKIIKNTEQAILTTSIEVYKDTEARYQDNEYSRTLPIAEQQPLYLDETVMSQALAWRKKTRVQKTVLILTFKSCHYITEQMLYDISRFCHCEYNLLQSYVNLLNAELIEKRQRREAYVSKIGRVYHFKIRKAFQKQDSDYLSEAYKKYDIQQSKHESVWQNRLTSLYTKRLVRIVPTNQRLSELIGISTRQIVRYHTEAKERLAAINIDFLE